METRQERESRVESYFYAIATANLKNIKKCLRSDPNLLRLDLNSVTSLMHAIKGSHGDAELKREKRRLEVVSFLTCERTTKEQDYCGRTALMYAAERDALDLLEVVLPHSELATEDREGKTALQIAAQSGSLRCLQTLMVWTDRNPQPEPNGRTKLPRTPLMLAAEEGHLDCVKWLTSVRPEWVDQTGATDSAFELAWRNNHLECAEFLLLSGSLERAHTLIQQVDAARQWPQTSARIERDYMAQSLAKTEGQDTGLAKKQPIRRL